MGEITTNNHSAISAINPYSKASDTTQLNQMEDVQTRVNPHLSDGLSPQVDPLKGVPPAIQEELMDAIDNFCVSKGYKSLTERLSELHARISAVVERHILGKQNRNHDKEIDIKANVAKQKTLKYWQATTQGGVGAFGTAIASIIASAIGIAPSAIEAISKITPQTADTIIKVLEGQIGPLTHEQQEYLQKVTGDRQAADGLKNLTEQQRNLLLEIMRLLLRVAESIFQR